MHLVEFLIKQAILGKYSIKRATFESFEEKSKVGNNFAERDREKKFPMKKTNKKRRSRFSINGAK